MAKCNMVMLYGQVVYSPRVIVDSEGRMMKASLTLRVVRRFNDDTKNIEYSVPQIITANPEMVLACTKLAKGDMCFVKGVITTLDLEKAACCECGHTVRYNGTVTFITPILIEARERLSVDFKTSRDTETEIQVAGQKLLKEKNEISNIIHIIGTLCKEPEYYQDPSNERYVTCQYPIASNRRYKIKEGTPDVKTDYPWVKSFGNIASENHEVLKVDSTVFIDGSVFTKVVDRDIECDKCGKRIRYRETVSEIHPYSVEYLSNCELPNPAGGGENNFKIY